MKTRGLVEDASEFICAIENKQSNTVHGNYANYFKTCIEANESRITDQINSVNYLINYYIVLAMT